MKFGFSSIFERQGTQEDHVETLWEAERLMFY